ncbi:MAG: hypothetical protein ACHP9U_05400 [Steroidobacterales bacterium]
MKAKAVLGMLCASAMLSTGLTPPVFAQEAFMHYEPWIHTGIPPRKAGTAETCPAIMWDIVRSPGAQKGTYTLRGPVWNEDGTGMSMATGELRPDRTFTFDINSVVGKGLTGTATGVLGRDGSRDLKMTGPGACDNMELHLKPGQTSAKR